MKQSIGFIGCGNMAQAIIGGIVNSGLVDKTSVMASAKTRGTVERIKEKYGIRTTLDNGEVAAFADVLFLAVKPDQHQEILSSIKENVKPDTIVIMMAAGITLQWMEAVLTPDSKIVRTMPNTPSLVGEGMTAYCVNGRVGEGEREMVHAVLESFGKAEEMDESLLDAIPAVSGSSPAYAFMFMEALADGAVKEGIPRKQAYNLAAQALLGAAKMVLETGSHPGELKDAVCSPGGATIEAVIELEKSGFKGSIVRAMDACTKKAKQLGRED